MNVRLKAKCISSKVAENPKRRAAQSVPWMEVTFMQPGQGLLNNFSHANNQIDDCESSGGGMHCYFAKVVWSADLFIPQVDLVYHLDRVSRSLHFNLCNGVRQWWGGLIGLISGRKGYRSKMEVIQVKSKGVFEKCGLTCHRLLTRLELFLQD